MGNATICCPKIIGQEIKGKDEELYRNCEQKENQMVNNNNENKSLSGKDSKTNKNNVISPKQRNGQKPLSDIGIKLKTINNNNINSISSTYQNKPNENSSQNSHKINNQQSTNKNTDQNFMSNNNNFTSNFVNNNNNEINVEFQEKKSEEEEESEKLEICSKIDIPSGDQYEGETKNGKPNGRGKYILASGEIREGTFINGELNGNGIIKKPNGEEFSGNFINNLLYGEGTYKNNKGETYTGEFKQGKKHGKGVLKLIKNNDKEDFEYEGDFENNEINGKRT